MKIEHLISALREAAATGLVDKDGNPISSADSAKPETDTKTIPFPKSAEPAAAAPADKTPEPAATEPAPAPAAAAAAPADKTPEPAATEPAATPTTGDPTLDQPLEPAAPGAPKPGLATRFGRGVGQLAKGVGAVAGGVAGMGRAFKKGYNAGAYTVGGPGTKAPGANRMAALSNIRGKQGGGPAAGGAGSDEIAQLRQQLANINQRMTRAGLEESKKTQAKALTESVNTTIIDAEFDVVAELKKSLQRIDYKS